MRASGFPTVAVAAMVLVLSGATAQADDSTKLSRTRIAEDRAWKNYVLDSPTETVVPKAVIVEGDQAAVVDPEALKAEDGRATTIRASGKGAPKLVLDLGVNVGGRVEVGVTKTDGTTVRLAYAEARKYLNENGDIVPGVTLAANDEPDGRTDDVTRAGAFSSPGIRGAQRWIQLQLQGAGEVSIDYVRVRVTHVRASTEDYVGRFLSSDDLLNRVWYGSAYTWNVSAFSDPVRGGNTIVTDAGKRDRWAWLGDLAIEDLMAQYGIRQAPKIIKDTLELFSCQQEPDGYLPMRSEIHLVCSEPGPADGSPLAADPTYNGLRLPEYTAWWIIATQRYAYGTGDDAFLRKMLPVIRRAIGYYRANLVDGLFFTRNEQGTVINWHPFDVAHGIDAHTQATWYRALGAAVAAERAVGDPAAVTALEAEARSLKDATIAQLWDDQVGALIVNTAASTRNHTYDAQAEGVLSGLLDGERANRALKFVETELKTKYGFLNGESTTDPYMSQYISPFIASSDVLGRFRNENPQEALDLIRKLYGYMVRNDPESTMWEKLDENGTLATYSPNGLGEGVIPNELLAGGEGTTSMAHPWSGAAMTALSQHVAGLQQTSAAWKTWRVAPQGADVRWAQGQVLTPQGALASRWERGAADRSYKLTVVAPKGAAGEVAVPLLGKDRTIARDGEVVWRAGTPGKGGVKARRDGDAVVFAQSAGTQTYAWGSAAAAKRCASRRAMTITLRIVPSERATVRVDGKIVKRVKPGTTRVRVVFRGRPRSRVVVTVTQGDRRLDRRVYRLCIKRNRSRS